MTFQPRMQNKIGGFSVVGGMHRRQWNGMVADIWNVNCAAQAGGYYVARDPRLFILLEQRGSGTTNVRPSPRAHGRLQNYDSGHISYIPADMELWVDMAGVEFVRHLDIHFDAEIISQRLMENIDPARLDRPQLHFNDPRMIALAEMIAAECENPEPLHDLYGDGLTLSLLINVLRLRGTQPRKRSGLAAWQLRRAVDYIEEHCTRAIRLEELAELTGLSQSHFSHAFKASTGLPPHQWQTQARLERAKHLLLNSEMPLTTVAVETGFADQAHFTRVFRKNVGAAPASWKRSKLA
ncbi:helix-turn-helix transcriptional regulator [Rhizobium sp. P40RR-XXII]|uniref:AraC family transcriptional regulator n=1 Tax=unclassified Rhizobium TaxID=2613769 RepID=UPI001456A23E|nr:MULTISPECIES: AraC family transcriptional regulator [unclassified Rhizobium]NLR85898.1 helix-turn-helix transcriptional regulator [Rhizobium sp. P28RR-XV]NLS19322.1 helix-turn-helix transcriptional regulator [Rhizobium sp. P40RR-XXII]